jgi:diketogulonate reductase-like aldo/keto reductase
MPKLHPWCQQREIETFCETRKITIQAHSAILQNQKESHLGLCAIAKNYGKITSQILIRYSLQKGWMPVLKATKPEHLSTNADVSNFTLATEDMHLLDSWDERDNGAIRSCPGSPRHA